MANKKEIPIKFTGDTEDLKKSYKEVDKLSDSAIKKSKTLSRNLKRRFNEVKNSITYLKKEGIDTADVMSRLKNLMSDETIFTKKGVVRSRFTSNQDVKNLQMMVEEFKTLAKLSDKLRGNLVSSRSQYSASIRQKAEENAAFNAKMSEAGFQDISNKNVRRLSEKFESLIRKADKFGNKGLSTKTSLATMYSGLEGSFGTLLSSYIEKVEQLQRAYLNTAGGADKLNKELTQLKRNFGNDVDNIVKKYSDGINDANDKLKELAKTMEAESKKTSALRKLGKRAGIYLSYRLINEATVGFENLVKAAFQMETKFADIQSITAATNEDMSKLKTTIFEVGQNSKFTVDELAEATTTLGQAGLSANEINNVLETTSNLAMATGSSLESTVDVMTSAISVWGLNSEEAEHLADVMVSGMNKTKATLDTFRMSVQYAGSTVAGLNVNFEDFAAVISAAANAGLRSSVIGTGLRAVISELQAPTVRLVENLSKLGITQEDVDIRSIGLIQTLQNLKDSGINASNAYQIFNKRAATFYVSLLGQIDSIEELRKAFSETDVAVKAAGIQMDTASAKFTALKNRMVEGFYEMQQSSRGWIDYLIAGINKVLDLISKFHSGFNYLTMSKTQNALGDTEEFVKGKSKVLLKGKNLESSLTSGKDSYTSDMIKLNNAIAKYNVMAKEEGGITIKQAENVEDLKDKYDELLKVLRGFNLGVSGSINNQISGVYNQAASIGLNDLLSSKQYDRASRSVISERAGLFGNKRKVSEALDKESTELFTEYFEDVKNRLKKGENLESINESYAKKGLSDLQKVILERAITSVKEALKTSNFLSNFLVKDSEEQIKKVVEQNQGNEVTNNWDKLSSENRQLKAKDINSRINNLLAKGLDERSEAVKALYKQLDELEKINIDLDYKSGNISDVEHTTALRDLETKILNRGKSKYSNGRMPQTDALLEAYKLRLAAAQYPSERVSAYRQGALNYLNENSTAGMSELYGYYSNKASKLESLKAGIVNKQTLNDMKKSYGDLFDAVNKGQISVEEADRKSNNVVSTMLSLDKSIQQVEGEFGNLDNVSLDNINEQLSTLNDKLNAIRNSSLSPWKKFAEGWYKTVQEMAKQYDSVSLGKLFAEDVGNGLSNALYEISTSSKSVKESFKDMARSIVEDLNKMIIKMIVFKAIEAGVNSFIGIEDMGGTKTGDAPIPTPRPTRGAATGGLVRGGTANRDSVGAKLMPGEYVLKKSAVDALGTNFLNDLNTNAAQTLSNTAAQLGGMSYDNESASEPSVVNVWVVSKEEEAQMGPNDIIATISRDIRNGGQTKRLIQSVVAGRK